MKSIKLAGLCLVAVFAVSLVASATASAVPTWKQCVENTGAGTKWEDNKCSKALSTGKWEWKELTTTEAVKTEGSLKLTIKEGGVFGKPLVIECYETWRGTVGPGKYGRITQVTVASCHNIEECRGTIQMETRNLPWQTELLETEGHVRNKITSEVSGKEPGRLISCEGRGFTCEGNLATAMTNNQTLGFVEATFDAKSPKWNCGGVGNGEITGTYKIKSEAGFAIKVS